MARAIALQMISPNLSTTAAEAALSHIIKKHNQVQNSASNSAKMTNFSIAAIMGGRRESLGEDTTSPRLGKWVN